ncbi:MAG: hypothetical protein PUB51_06010 [Oscillospiraceae bacterium]|nr:hypothetical protein [Oscillospiraceae bacterium]
MVRSFLARLMAGRYGADQLNNTLLVCYLICYLISLLSGLTALYWISLVLLFVALFRCLSRQIDRRREENAQFMKLYRPIRQRCQNLRMRLRDKDHCYFRCPNCKQQMRVPKGKGRITVHCRSCGATFEKKS